MVTAPAVARTSRLLLSPRAAALGLVVLAVVLVAAFDVAGPAVAFNDDWTFHWNVDHFPRIYPAASALAFPQTAWAWLITFGNHDPRLLRLSELPFLVVALLALHWTARAAGADRTWAALAALSFVACPVLAGDATTFMTDVPYLCLELAAVVAAIRWQEQGRSPAPFVVLVVLAALQRQTGALLPAGVALALLAGRRWNLRDWAWTALALLLAAGALGFVAVAGLGPPTQGTRLQQAAAIHPVFVATTFMFLPGAVGLGLAVMAPGLVVRARGAAFGRLLGPLAAGLVAWEVLTALIGNGTVFPGNVLTRWGLNPQTVPGSKPALFPEPVFLGLEVLAVVAAAAFVLRLRDAVSGRPRVVVLLLAGVAVTQLAPLLAVDYVAFDRYYLPATAALLPLAARAAGGASDARAWIAVAIGAALLGVYAAGEQDYQAWQAARASAVQAAYRQAPPSRVDAGYEPNAAYVDLPAYDRSGTILDGLNRPGVHDFASMGPVDPLLRIEVVGAGDRRAGYPYDSLAPGKLIIQRP